MERILESELMDDPRQAAAYARAAFSASNQRFADGLVRDFPQHLRTAVDLGCGTADVLIRLARAAPDLHVTGVDGSAPMLALARDAVLASGLTHRIMLAPGRLPGLPVQDHTFDAVLSKDLLHHLPDPAVLWREVTRLGRPGALVSVMDLVRPDTGTEARRIVAAVSGGEDPILQEDFFNSLLAAFTVNEVQEQVAAARLDLKVAQISDRHMLASGRLPAP
jgi:ubiquinone/menaquinone biosynthesis C-methylase UbiE